MGFQDVIDHEDVAARASPEQVAVGDELFGVKLLFVHDFYEDVLLFHELLHILDLVFPIDIGH